MKLFIFINQISHFSLLLLLFFQTMPNFLNIVLTTGITFVSLAMVRDVSGSALDQEENGVQEQGHDASSGSAVSGYTENGSHMRNHDEHVKRQFWYRTSTYWA